MSRTSATFSVSLPPAMARELERVRKHEHRTRSELVREALRHYMVRSDDAREMRQRIAVLPEEEATAEEIEAIEEARRAFRDGNFVTLDHVRHGMGHRLQQSRGKKSPARSRR
jgi:metal-responsive CopG/Arc/MetJ family transcriptional regulator